MQRTVTSLLSHASRSWHVSRSQLICGVVSQLRHVVGYSCTGTARMASVQALATVALLTCSIGLCGASAQSDSIRMWCPVDFDAWRTTHAGLVEQGLYHEDSVSVRPQRISSPEVRYPPELRPGGWTGLVHMLAVVDTLGSTIHVEPVQASARLTNREARQRAFTQLTPQQHEEARQEAATHFSEAAVAVVVKARFRPGSVDGRSVNTVVCIPIEFVFRTP